jgi:putative membrane protein
MSDQLPQSSRAPQAFIIKEPDAAENEPHKVKSSSGKRAVLTFDTEPLNLPSVSVPVTDEPNTPRRWRLLSLLASAVFALFTMWVGLTVTQLVEDFFARSAILGWIALAIASAAALAAIGIVGREIWGLLRLQKISDLQDNAARAINTGDRKAATDALEMLNSVFANDPRTTAARAQYEQHQAAIMHPEERLKLADRMLLEPRDEEARTIIARRARRVTLITTVTPAAALDILFVATQNLMMLRELATLYGGRPSTLSTLRLARMVATHLAVTGGLALSDTFLQQVIGKGLLGRISARFGEGAINGILTCRIGLAAMRLCRPIPSTDDDKSRLSSMVKELFSLGRE